jgi:hypothetical protein
LAGTLACSTALAAFGQYSINWFKISGGGGSGSNGRFSVNVTIGQHDAGAGMTGGAYSVTGAFWVLYAVQSPGAPLLTVFLTPTNTAVVSWPSPSTGFELRQNASLSTTNWGLPPQSVNDNGVTKFIIVNRPAGNWFYQLQHL